jgi:hypothetical protein
MSAPRHAALRLALLATVTGTATVAVTVAVAVAVTPAVAVAAETPQWPPPTGVEARMRELQSLLGSREATAAQREAAREELSGLLKSPAGQARGRSRDEKPTRPARAAIDPFPAIVKPAAAPSLGPAPPVARVEVVVPPKPLVMPGSGAVIAPANGFAIDPRTGNVLHEIPGGYIDPRTGQIVPR